MSVATTELRPGYAISRVIKGGWQLAGDHGPVDRAVAIRDMEAFVEAGITTFDCADIYTGVEEMIGEMIAGLRQRRGAEVANRAQVHTKLVPDLGRLSDLRPEEVEAIVDRSLSRLQIERLHLVQFFWWDLAQGDPRAAYAVLERCVEKGKIAHLGTTNWDIAGIERFCGGTAQPISAQVQYSLLDRRPENGLVDWARGQEVHLLCYGTLAGGFLTEAWRGVADPGYAFENRSLIKYRLIIDEFGGWERFQTLLTLLKEIGDRHGVSLPTVATAWVLDRPQVAAAIVGARTARHLPQTLEVCDVTLDAKDRAAIDALLAEAPGPQGPVYGLESDRSGRHGRIMKYNLNARPDDAVLGAADD